MTNKLFYIKIGSFSYVTECYEYKNSKIKGMVSTLDKRKALKMLIEEIINDEYTEDNKKEVQIEQLEIIDLEESGHSEDVEWWIEQKWSAF